MKSLHLKKLVKNRIKTRNYTKKIGEILLKIQEGISSHINTDKATDSVLEVQDDRIE